MERFDNEDSDSEAADEMIGGGPAGSGHDEDDQRRKRCACICWWTVFVSLVLILPAILYPSSGSNGAADEERPARPKYASAREWQLANTIVYTPSLVPTVAPALKTNPATPLDAPRALRPSRGRGASRAGEPSSLAGKSHSAAHNETVN
mmetsp:Transcript_5873/g.13582  ORF Transcript_5873/g.13582 Transcript_5873/m.13582 type:complete len:149 (+) Transcript_5873:278-724(+)